MKYRCKQCGYEFSDFSGRWIGKLNISCRDWLWLVKLFELELSSRKIATQLGLSHPLFQKDKRGRGAAGKIPIFGILECNGIVKVEVLKRVSAESILNLAIKTVRRSSIVYTDRYRGYDALMFCGYRHVKIDHTRYFARGRVYINGVKGFWSFAKERLIKFHGISKEKFPVYLKEMEFRYNNRDRPLFPILIQCLCDLMEKIVYNYLR